MIGKRWLVAGVVAILLAGSGCVCCGNKGHAIARVVAPDCDVPSDLRSQVYVFLVGGLNPVASMSLDSFREEINRQGYAKVATGTTAHAAWMAREMRRIRVNEPNAVFVLVGCESGTPAAVRLAERAVADGLPVGGVVLIDAAGKTPAPSSVGRTLTIGAGYGQVASSTAESVAVPAAGRFGLLADPQTVAAVTRLLNDVAVNTAQPLVVTEPVEVTYPHAVPPRPTLDVGSHTEWAFLFDQPGIPSRPLDETAPVVAAKSDPGVSSTPFVRKP